MTIKYVVKRRYMNEGEQTDTIITGPLPWGAAQRCCRRLSQDYQSTQYYVEELRPGGMGLIS